MSWNMMKSGISGRLLLLMLFSCLLVPALGMAQKGPGVIMQDLEGAFHGLDEFTGQGKWTVVMLWASDCHACNEEAHQYVKFHEDHKNSDATVLGISLDGKQKLDDAKQFVTRHGVSFPNLINEPLQVMQFYSGATGQAFIGTPTLMVYDPQGKLRGAQVGAVPVDIIEAFIARESVARQSQGNDDG